MAEHRRGTGTPPVASAAAGSGLSRRRWTLALVLAFSVACIFARVVGFPFIAFDDAHFIVQNPEVNGAHVAILDRLLTPTVGYVVPVTVNLEAVLYALSDGQAWSFHSCALLLHTTFAVQLMLLLCRFGAALPTAFVAALAFACHPLCVQPVAWAICLKDLLMANAALAATRFFVAPQASRGTLLAAVLLAVSAMLAKPSATLLGLAWLAWLGAHGELRAGAKRPAVRAAAWTVGLGILIALASRFAHDTLTDASPPRGWSPLFAVSVLGRQAAHALWPANLLITYPNPTGNVRDPWMFVGGATATAGLACLWRARRRPEVALLLSLATVAYVPTSNILPFARVISDSYMYIPLAGAVGGISLWSDRALRSSPIAVRLAVGTLALLIALELGATSGAQLPRYRGGRALWEPVIRTHPRLAEAHRLYADELLFRGDPKGAVPHYRRAFALLYDPRYLLEYGTLLSMADQLSDAECVLIEAVAHGTNPGYAVYNYAAMLAVQTDFEPRFPGITKQLLDRFEALRRSGRVRWPRALERGLVVQLGRLRNVDPRDLIWPRRNCPALAAASANTR